MTTVSNSAELLSALSMAQGGDLIELVAGNYGDFAIADASFANHVTLRSVDLDAPAVFNTIEIRNSFNVTIDSIMVDFIPAENTVAWSSAFRIVDSSDITLSNSVLEGGPAVNGVPEDATELDATLNVLGLPAGRGLSITNSSNIVIESNEISEFGNGIVPSNNNGLSVLNTDIHHLRGSPITGANNSNVIIDGCHFHSFAPWQWSTGSGDHGDLIHFWTQTGQTVATDNIQITNNFFEQGDGLASLLGIYLEDNNGLSYTNVLIENNVIFNGNRQGLRLENIDGGIIRNNTMIQSSGDALDNPGIVLTMGARNVTAENNILGHLTISDTADAATITTANNIIVDRFEPTAEYYYGGLFVDPFAPGATLADLMLIPFHSVSLMGVGAAMTQFDTTPSTVTGLILVSMGDGIEVSTATLDASNIFGPSGPLDTTGASYAWDFGDGTSGFGPSHPFASAGQYTVVATVTLTDGSVVTIDRTLLVESPIALSADFESGFFDLSGNETPIIVTPEVTLEAIGTGTALRLGGGKLFFARRTEHLNNSEYTVLIDFKKDPGAELATGKVLYFAGSFVVNVEAKGVAIYVKTDVGSGWFNTGNINLDDSEWHTLALTFDGALGSAIFYIDGQEVARLDGLIGGVQVGSIFHDLHVGDQFSAGFGGLIDNFYFLRGAMTAEDVAAYDSGVGLQLAGPPPPLPEPNVCEALLAEALDVVADLEAQLAGVQVVLAAMTGERDAALAERDTAITALIDADAALVSMTAERDAASAALFTALQSETAALADLAVASAKLDAIQVILEGN